MYISKITLKNVRGFESLEFNLDRGNQSFAGWTVFTGDNGSGKTTLIRAIALGIAGKEIARSILPSFRGWIRGNASSEASISLNIAPEPVDDRKLGRPTKSPFEAVLAFENNEGPEPVLVSKSPAKSKKAPIANQSIWSTNPQGWFACGYGPFRRVFGASAEAQRLMSAPSTSRWVTLFNEAATLREVDEWLRDIKYKALEEKEDQKRELDVVLSILRDEFLPREIQIDGVDSEGLWLRDSNGVRLSWTEMSDGYRAAVALLSDILRQMIRTYGFDGLYAQDESGKIQIVRSGVVLIDEVDAHLHPSWQREIGFWLKRHFPRVQFLVTSHSPIIVQAADRNGVFVLPEPGSKEPPHALSQEEYSKVIASRPDTILLSSAFGLQNTRSEPIVQKRAQYSKLQSKKKAGSRLSPAEEDQLQTLLPFVRFDEED